MVWNLPRGIKRSKKKSLLLRWMRGRDKRMIRPVLHDDKNFEKKPAYTATLIHSVQDVPYKNVLPRTTKQSPF